MPDGRLTQRGKSPGSARAGTASTMRNPPAPQHGQRVTSLPVRRSNVASHVSGAAGGGEGALGADGPSTARTVGRSRLRAELASQPQ